MNALKLSRIAILLATSAALYSSTQAFPQTTKGEDGAITQPPSAESAETAKIRLTRKSAAQGSDDRFDPPPGQRYRQ